MRVGNIVRIRRNIEKILSRYGYEKQVIEDLAALTGTEHKVHGVSTEGNRRFVMLDLTVELPVQCCLLIR